MQKTVELIKASAGAGKTYFLTNRYIDLLLDGGEDSYRHILAVTFTNKATEEMKSRIVEKLSEIASDPSDSRCEKAKSRLTRILHDYSGFSICTIDSFFQSVMRAFAREIGQYASYRVELDQNAVLSQAVDMMMDSLADQGNSELLEWLKKLSFQMIQEGRSWNIKKPLEEMAGQFFKEDFKLLVKENGDALLSDLKGLGEFDKKLKSIIGNYEESCVKLGQEVMKWLGDQGLGWNDFHGKSHTKINLFEKWAKGSTAPATDDLYISLSKLGNGAYPELRAMIAEAIKLSDSGYETYCTALAIKQNLYLLGIYSDLYKNLRSYLSENNVVLLGETTDCLNRIIDGNDTPFVYEKIGSRYDHIMLDESQDTSVLQWGNFKPLFNEAVSKGCSNLIVGDIKQSIYRWRGSDWRLISDYVYRDLGEENIEDYSDPDNDNPLGDNWRSSQAIVDFNNDLFLKVGEEIESESREAGAEIGRIYGGCHQNVPEKRKSLPQGRVKISFLEHLKGGAWKEVAMEKMVADIEELKSNGYRHKDITVLVRKNAEGADVAKYLIERGYDVMTEDSLLIGSSPCVQSVINCLSCKADPTSPASKLLAMQGVRAADQNGCSLYEMCEKMIASLPEGVAEQDVPFVNAFLDCVLTYQDKYGSSLRGFIRYWEESGCKKAICAPKGRDAIRVMTIHKSKGLSLEAVIVPFLEEPFIPGAAHTPTIWCETSGCFSELGVIPVKANSRLSNTLFKADYESEKLYEYVDVVNTVYVAFTRAKSQLIVYATAPDKKNDFNISSFANLLYSYCSTCLDGNDTRAGLDENDTIVFGELTHFTSEGDVAEGDLQTTFNVVPLGDRLKVSTQWEDYFNPDVNPRMRGIAYHDILSKMDTLGDLEKACGGDADAFEFLSAHIAPAVERHWFDGTYDSLNEASVILPDGTTQRPDRVLITKDGKKAVIVDYKFGKPLRKYAQQVEQYCSLIRSMGYSEVEGYLWYVESATVEKVC